MKMTKKLLSVVLAIAMSASLMVPVFASPLSESEYSGSVVKTKI